ncbi:MAG: GHKL domain-containing protein [Lachnospiraceae bacterium]|nr:GHKL domain-containing protein [Lachnospiraceae bacterium]
MESLPGRAERHKMQIIGLIITVLMSLYAAHMQRQRGAAKAWGMGTGFLTVGVYLDSLFFLIIGHGAGGNAVLQKLLWPERMRDRIVWGIGLFVSKGILTAALLAAAAAREQEPDESPQGSAGDLQSGAESGWDYLDGLTVGINLFFLLLAAFDMNGYFTLRTQGRDGGMGAVLIRSLFLAILLSYYASLHLHRKKQRLKRERQEADARKHEAEIYLESVENHYQRTRELWHDLRNHISLLRLFLQEEKYEQMADYLRIFGEDAESLALPVKSGNTVVDALLADKTARAKRDGAAVELSLCDLSDLRLRPDEICGLLGNLLDNALEANRRAESGRFLAIECENRETYCYIRIRNADGGQPGNIKKDRKNQVGHGLGLRSAQRIAHGCGGELAVERGAGCFTAVVRLPRDRMISS